MEEKNNHIRDIFKKYYQRWEEETAFMSSSDMFENPNYKAIIDMGWDAVPHIIDQLREKPCHLFKALKKITGVNPINPENVGRVSKMAKDWIEWYDSLKPKNEL
jgi:hypothetical protein